jgi:hypothetical protein
MKRTLCAQKAMTLLALGLLGGSLLAGCSKPEPEVPVNARVTADGKPAPPGSENAPARPGMDMEGKGGKGKGGP